MRINSRRKWGKILAKWTPFFIIACTFTGALLGSLLFYIFQGEFPYEVLISGGIVAIVFTIVEIVKQKRAKDDLPEADERVIRNVFHYFSYTSHIFLAILFVGVAIFTLVGYESISIYYLWVLFFTYIWVTGIGALIVKRR